MDYGLLMSREGSGGDRARVQEITIEIGWVLGNAVNVHFFLETSGSMSSDRKALPADTLTATLWTHTYTSYQDLLNACSSLHPHEVSPVNYCKWIVSKTPGINKHMCKLTDTELTLQSAKYYCRLLQMWSEYVLAKSKIKWSVFLNRIENRSGAKGA